MTAGSACRFLRRIVCVQSSAALGLQNKLLEFSGLCRSLVVICIESRKYMFGLQIWAGMFCLCSIESNADPQSGYHQTRFRVIRKKGLQCVHIYTYWWADPQSGYHQTRFRVIRKKGLQCVHIYTYWWSTKSMQRRAQSYLAWLQYPRGHGQSAWQSSL